MARLLKNPDISPGSLAARLPIATSTLSDAPVNGLIRFNSTTNTVQFYYNSKWNDIAKVGTVQLVADQFTGDGVTTQFTASRDATTAGTFIAINGSLQQPVSAYSISGNVITFTERLSF